MEIFLAFILDATTPVVVQRSPLNQVPLVASKQKPKKNLPLPFTPPDVGAPGNRQSGTHRAVPGK